MNRIHEILTFLLVTILPDVNSGIPPVLGARRSVSDLRIHLLIYNDFLIKRRMALENITEIQIQFTRCRLSR